MNLEHDMRPIGTLHPTEGVPLPPDTVYTLLIAGSSGQAVDWPTNTQIVRLSGVTTSGAALNFVANLFSTAAAAPSSGLSTSSTAANHPVSGALMFQVPGGSTGFSVAALSSGYVFAECWRR
jgi:hypothetical protein